MEVNIMDFIVEGSLWIIPVLMCVGVVLKSVPKLPDWTIPLLLYGIGLLLGYMFIDKDAIGLLQGLLCATAAIGIHQGIKQPIKAQTIKNNYEKAKEKE